MIQMPDAATTRWSMFARLPGILRSWSMTARSPTVRTRWAASFRSPSDPLAHALVDWGSSERNLTTPDNRPHFWSISASRRRCLRSYMSCAEAPAALVGGLGTVSGRAAPGDRLEGSEVWGRRQAVHVADRVSESHQPRVPAGSSAPHFTQDAGYRSLRRRSATPRCLAVHVDGSDHGVVIDTAARGLKSACCRSSSFPGARRERSLGADF